jgi:hypothetical protein
VQIQGAASGAWSHSAVVGATQKPNHKQSEIE